jgi:ligand-binding sensor domain-containing protein
LLALHPDGSVWTNADEPVGALYPLTGDRSAARSWPLPRHTNRFIIDHDGYAWASDRTGVFRAAAAAAHAPAQRMGVEQGLSGRKIQALFEDREHNVWVGTESGLDRFRAPRLRAAAMPEQLTSNSIPIAGGAGASVWADHSFVADPRTPSRVYARAPAGLDDVITALHRGRDGRVWAAGFAGLWAVAPDGSGWRHLYPGDGTTTYAMTQDSAGTLWMAMGRRGVVAWRDGKWIPGGGVPGLSTFAAATVAADEHGRVWIGSTGNDLALLEGGRARHFGPTDGLAVGTVVQVLPADDGAWVGGENGLMYFDGTRFSPVEGREHEPFAGITGLVFARDGTLWVNGADGISSIAPDELRRAASEPDPSGTVRDPQRRRYAVVHDGRRPVWIRPRHTAAQHARPARRHHGPHVRQRRLRGHGRHTAARRDGHAERGVHSPVLPRTRTHGVPLPPRRRRPRLARRHLALGPLHQSRPRPLPVPRAGVERRRRVEPARRHAVVRR